MADNVYSNAKIVNKNDNIEEYKLGTFINNQVSEGNDATVSKNTAVLSNAQESSMLSVEPLLDEIKNLHLKLDQITSKVSIIENEGVRSKDIDAQVVQAIKDLKHYAAFFEQATFQMETKLLKTSISIAKKIINIEVGENSSLIARQTITQLLEKIKTASKVQIHLNPKDYEILKDQLNLDPLIELRQDPNVTAGGVVIASDLGNFDGNIEAKVTSMLETLDTVI
ncbi:hypothetical protein GCM10012288_08100 [Malaciobacter pacificus]|uniref:Flagellar assembly protein FliH n=1 Tax=Malaciobacter pacificus TaxID=1080223 RepID=A0A5C2H9X0_9BACT|nr:FliH/SctL family protein [Malaciobacter pacificus]QEP35139.1 flagellar export apparatus, cytoplasmic ATPase complex, FliH component [Malaciobacter pacificus]GGD36465.1 hypothetical protein GCM10012288_08100 [Malaciobacter pacificus]